MKKHKKIKYLSVVLIIFLFFIFIFSRGHIYDKSELEYGVTFSAKQARSLGLEPQKVFQAMIHDLGVEKIRLAAYWDEIEAQQGVFSYDDLDWQVAEAQKAKAEIVLAVGGRLPRWPECHFPKWLESVNQEEREERTLIYIKKTIERYKDIDNIIAWQVENEPFLSNFGECPKLDSNFLDQEIALVRSLDKRPIVITDSGELSLWLPAAKRADIFGTTMYRDTYSKQLRSYIHYPIGPGFMRFKKNIVSMFTRPKKWVVIELQAEPWGPVPYQELSAEERAKTMDLNKFRDILEFSRKTGFKEFYLWGVEWWYWEKEVNNNDNLWREARTIFHK